MDKVIIAVYGSSNEGKSKTIYNVYTSLLSKGAKTVKIINIKVNVDIRVVIEIDGVNIGVHSPGDIPSQVEDIEELASKYDCKVILCAHRIRGGTTNAVSKIAKKYNYSRIRLSSYWSDDEHLFNDLNKMLAESIIKVIRTIVIPAKAGISAA